MRPAALAATLFSGVDGPTIVCAQAGNVNSGVFDPFAEICDIAHEHGAWVHIDGAFGLWAAASQQHRHLLDGSSERTRGPPTRTSGSTCPTTAASRSLRTPRTTPVRSPPAPSISCSAMASAIRWTSHRRRHAALARSRCWAALQSLGRAGVAELVERCCARARQFADALRGIPGVEIANDVVINQIVVRFPGLDGVLEAVSASGACVMTPTTWKGEPGVRISVSNNWRTSAPSATRPGRIPRPPTTLPTRPEPAQ